MNYIKIKTRNGYERVPYFEKENGWWVNSEQVDGERNFRRYTISDAREMDLRQLLKKEYDVRY